jgi:hypothetical protein
MREKEYLNQPGEKTTGINKYLSTIALNINGLNSVIRNFGLVVGLKSKIQLFIMYKKYSSLAKTYTY